ncbi:hypothetical protein ACHAWF_002158 [Thalassiosira exigua]
MFFESGMNDINNCPCFDNGIRACPGKKFRDGTAGPLLQDAMPREESATASCQ